MKGVTIVFGAIIISGHFLVGGVKWYHGGVGILGGYPEYLFKATTLVFRWQIVLFGVMVHGLLMSDGYHWYHWYMLRCRVVFGLWLVVGHGFVVFVLMSMEWQHMSVFAHVMTVHG